LLLILLGKTVGGASDWRDALLDSFTKVLPPDASAALDDADHTVDKRRSRTGSGVCGLGISKRNVAMMTGLNKAYEIEEKPMVASLLGFLRTFGADLGEAIGNPSGADKRLPC
jgi:uncharacterized BrkB/YihY/UPF0761 family membrane protein